MNKKRLVVILVLVLVIAAAVWRSSGQSSLKPQYQTAKVERGTVVSSVSASGQVITAGRFPVLSQASGQVKEVYVKNGDTVAAGQKILSLTPDLATSSKNATAWSNYLSAKASFYSLQSTMFTKWKTFMDLAESASYDSAEERNLPQFHIAEKDWLKAEADYKNQQAVVNAAWLSYLQTAPDLVSPVAGTIADLTSTPGMLVSGPETIASIVTFSRPTVTVNLSEVDVNKVSEGNKATLTFDALPGKTFPGKITGINKTGVVTSGVTNYPATIQLDSTPSEILPNMSASANIIIQTKDNVLKIPSEAIQTQNNQAQVRLLQNNRSIFVPVETGISSDTQTEIISGLSEGDVVITGTVTPAASQGRSPFSTFNVGGGGIGAPRR